MKTKTAEEILSQLCKEEYGTPQFSEVYYRSDITCNYMLRKIIKPFAERYASQQTITLQTELAEAKERVKKLDAWASKIERCIEWIYSNTDDEAIKTEITKL